MQNVMFLYAYIHITAKSLNIEALSDKRAYFFEAISDKRAYRNTIVKSVKVNT